MRNKCCDQESAFEHIWKHADEDGMWAGDAASVAEEFGVSENEAHEVLGELCDRGLVEELYREKYAIVKWRDRNGRSGKETAW
jgi:predicted transcriptional regulator of viral defense system